MSCVRWGEEGERRLVVHHGRPRKKKGDGNEGADSAMTGGKEKGGGVRSEGVHTKGGGGLAAGKTRGRRSWVGGAGTLPPKIGEAGSPTGGALAIGPHGLNPFDRVKVIQTV
jgi:hypothetical protein